MQLRMEQVALIHNLYEQIKDQNMPIQTAYKMVQISNACAEHFHFFEDKMKQIIGTYSEKDSNGNPILLDDNKSIKIRSDSIEECQKQIFELSNLKVELPDKYFTLDELKDLKLSLDNMRVLMPFIKENEKVEE